MALLDFLKRKKEIEKSKPVEKTQGKPLNKTPDKPAEKKAKKALVAKKEAAPVKHSISYEVAKEPHISEKATLLAEKNKYVFKVYQGKNKPEIKRSIEGIYGVNVLKVALVKIPPKKRRLGRTEGFRKSYIKAIVTIKEGQKIEIF